ncbi:MAG: thioredoxin family protein [Elainellaceae cyanobacterium]
MSDKSTESSTRPSWQSEGKAGGQIRNFIIVVVAVVLSVAVFLGWRSPTGAASLSTLADESTPLNVALTNHKPTLMEFYANWCTSCQAMAGDLSELKQDYGDRLNFVMLNVDNSKWLPEMLEYRVDGIPHFVFLDAEGQAIASVIGEQPQPIMADNLDALVTESPLPHVRDRGRTTDFQTPTAVPGSVNDDPRSHGSQVVNP